MGNYFCASSRVRPAKYGNVPAPTDLTFETVASWSDDSHGFRNVMLTGKHHFFKYLEDERSTENLIFHWEVEKYKEEVNVEKLKEKANIIYEDFLKDTEGNYAVNLSGATKEEIINSMKNSDYIYNNSLFNRAQREVYTNLSRDNYPRFRTSQMYKDLLASFGGQEEEE